MSLIVCVHGVPVSACFYCAADSPWCTAMEAATFLGYALSSIHRFCRTGALDVQMIPARHGGLRCRITRSSVLAFRAARSRKASVCLARQQSGRLPATYSPRIESPILGGWQRLSVEQFVKRANALLAAS